jgi:hypothetical protein
MLRKADDEKKKKRSTESLIYLAKQRNNGLQKAWISVAEMMGG